MVVGGSSAVVWGSTCWRGLGLEWSHLTSFMDLSAASSVVLFQKMNVQYGPWMIGGPASEEPTEFSPGSHPDPTGG